MTAVPDYIPTTPAELAELGWEALDVILITGDTYIDSPYIGVTVIGRLLLQAGYKVGIIAQPDVRQADDISRLGEPRLFWGVTAGCVDSMIANQTAAKKRRRQDDLTPGGINNRRPDRALIVYTNLLRRYFKNTRPIVLGGIEASLRRISHYDYWSDSVKRSVLFDAKADILVYGMGEKTVLELADRFRTGQAITDVRGICYISGSPAPAAAAFATEPLALPSHTEVAQDKNKFSRMFQAFYDQTEPRTARPLYQQQDTRYLVQNPPPLPPTTAELDEYFALPYRREAHPYYRQQGEIRALETIRFSITTHRGCYGECRFCAITAHQGRTIAVRSPASIIKEAKLLAAHPGFKGYIHDLGGPTANMYGIDCPQKASQGACRQRHCLVPQPCRHLKLDHSGQLALLKKLRELPGIKKIFIASGIRYDLVLKDVKCGRRYLEEVIAHHISGQMKIAPEHCEDRLLQLMGKPGAADLARFKELFDGITAQSGKPQFLTYYFIAAHPGCTLDDMRRLQNFAKQKLRLRPEQVQIFTPTPSTYSTLMYYTGTDPFSGRPLFVEKDPAAKEKQKKMLCWDK